MNGDANKTNGPRIADAHGHAFRQIAKYIGIKVVFFKK